MQKNNIPIVSVLMTVFNREKYISHAIESVLASKLQDWELIIVDDKSSDNSLEIAEKYASVDKRIKVYQNEKNLGDYPNRNKAASLARAKYIKYLDSDDMIYPYGLNILVDAMEENPDAALALTVGNGVDSRGRIYPVLSKPRESYEDIFFHKDKMLSSAPGGFIIKRDIFEKENGFHIPKQLGDYEFLLRVYAKYPIVKARGTIYFSREHEEQELRYDSQIDKLIMSRQILINILNKEFVPLSYEEKVTIVKNNRKIMIRLLFSLFFKKFNFAESIKIYKALKSLKLIQN